MSPEALLRQLSEVPLDERRRPVRLRLGAEELSCGSVDEARSRLGRRAASKEDWITLRTAQGKPAWVNLREVLREERALLLKERLAEPTTVSGCAPARELLAEGLRRRKYVFDADALPEWASSNASSRGTRSTLTAASCATLVSEGTSCDA